MTWCKLGMYEAVTAQAARAHGGSGWHESGRTRGRAVRREIASSRAQQRCLAKEGERDAQGRLKASLLETVLTFFIFLPSITVLTRLLEML